ncbi:alpha/beta fold hydrolase [Aquabacterium humicola]|uniref:alpha/beta fold hydrolase n=1 Tax=Aquabacterium humicola TaxID=3237377 RepID=UPI0025435727|nr:alpha/beta hydrolase [Rubrivivax pictus]
MDQPARFESPADAGIDTFDLTLPHGITLSCRGAGAADAPQRVVLLHGFPEAAFVWDEVMAALGGAAVRCVAPNLRGYERSSAPEGIEAYRAKHLVADLVALIEAIGAPIDVLVAHDWGGAVGWNLAALRPDLVKQLVVINSPHPGTFLRELRDNPAQQAASDYMSWLVRPDAAVLLAQDDFARLFATLDRFGRADWLTPALRERYRAVWSCGLEGPLNYYRVSPLRPPTAGDRSIDSLQLPDSVLKVALPTRVLWGDADAALLPVLLQGLSQWVPDLSVRHVPDATHWIVHERPALVIETIADALRDARAA